MSTVTSEVGVRGLDRGAPSVLRLAQLNGDPSSYDRSLGLDPAELVAFLEASQPEE